MWTTLAQDADPNTTSAFKMIDFFTPMEDIAIVWLMLGFGLVQTFLVVRCVSRNWSSPNVRRWSWRCGVLTLMIAAAYSVWVVRRSLNLLVEKGGTVDGVDFAASVGPGLDVLAVAMILCSLGLAASWVPPHPPQSASA